MDHSKQQHEIPAWVLSKMQQYCAFQERSMFDVKTKLKTFHLQDDIYDQVIIELKKENYLNEERYAKLFANGKLRINKWGRNKIYAALQQKKVPELFILEGINSIDVDEYFSILKNVIQKKSQELNEPDTFKRNKKLVKFALSKGFESNVIWKVLNIPEG
jgi:regulatory protein